VLIGLGWLLIATAAGAAGMVSALRPPAPPLVLLGLTAIVLAAGWLLAGCRAWLAVIDARWLVGLHLTRFAAHPRHRSAYMVWNVLGLADILFVVVTAARLGTADPASMAALLRLPLSLLPTFLVPLIVASHLVLGVRLARREADSR
jgi:hypothetical protein